MSALTDDDQTWIGFSLSLTLGDRHFYDIVSHQRATLQWPYEIWHFVQYMLTHNSATMQQACRSLHSLCSLVWLCGQCLAYVLLRITCLDGIATWYMSRLRNNWLPLHVHLGICYYYVY